MHRMLGALGALMLAIALIAGCGDDSTTPGTTTAGGASTTAGGAGTAMGPGLTVSEALTSTADGPFLVRGFLIVRDDEVRLCEALAESYPPQCGGSSLLVSGLDVEARDDLEEAEGTRWSPAEVMLLGDVSGETLEISTTASG